MPDCFCVPDAGARCSSARAVIGASDKYCGARCSGLARRESLRAAGRRYQHSRRGRHCHAERQRRYRRRWREDARAQKVMEWSAPLLKRPQRAKMEASIGKRKRSEP